MNFKAIYLIGIVSLLIIGTSGCLKNQEDEGRRRFQLTPLLWNASPPNGATDVDPRVQLHWSYQAVERDFDLYFGTDIYPPLLTRTNCYHYNPGPLEPNTTYYWRVAARSPVLHTEVSSFTVNDDHTLWNVYLGRGQCRHENRGYPRVYKDRVFQIGTDGHYHCLDAFSGKTLWKFSLQNSSTRRSAYMPGNPPESDDKIYLPLGLNLYCLDIQTGETLWTVSHPDLGWHEPVLLAGNRLFCKTNDGVYCLDKATGTEIWYSPFDMRGGIWMEDGRIFFSANDQSGKSWAKCVSADNGSLIWEKSSDPNNYFASLAVSNGRVFYYHGLDELHCINAENGTLNWKVDAEHSKPFPFNDTIFLSSDDYFTLLEARNGEVIWRTEAPVKNFLIFRHSNGAPVLVGESFVVADRSGYVCFLNKEDGSLHRKYFVSPEMRGIAHWGNLIYVAGEDGYIFCLKFD